MSEVVRLGGAHSDADACGTLMWAQTEGEIWWPAEVLDPFQLPPGRPLPPAALAGDALVTRGFAFGKIAECASSSACLLSVDQSCYTYSL